MANPTTTPTELAPGSPAPGVQVPLENQSPIQLPLGLENPQVLNQPPAGTPSADINAPVQRPQRLLQGEPPLGKGWGADGKLSLVPTGQLPLSVANSQTQNQANLVQLVAFPVLSRVGPQGVSWAAAIPLVTGVLATQVRGSYRDLKITPGFRGLQLCYPTQTGTVKVVENTTGAVYIFPTGPHTIFVPLFMLREIFDLTITSPGGSGWPAGSSALLTTEELLPYLF